MRPHSKRRQPPPRTCAQSGAVLARRWPRSTGAVGLGARLGLRRRAPGRLRMALSVAEGPDPALVGETGWDQWHQCETLGLYSLLLRPARVWRPPLIPFSCGGNPIPRDAHLGQVGRSRHAPVRVHHRRLRDPSRAWEPRRCRRNEGAHEPALLMGLRSPRTAFRRRPRRRGAVSQTRGGLPQRRRDCDGEFAGSQLLASSPVVRTKDTDASRDADDCQRGRPYSRASSPPPPLPIAGLSDCGACLGGRGRILEPVRARSWPFDQPGGTGLLIGEPKSLARRDGPDHDVRTIDSAVVLQFRDD